MKIVFFILDFLALYFAEHSDRACVGIFTCARNRCAPLLLWPLDLFQYIILRGVLIPQIQDQLRILHGMAGSSRKLSPNFELLVTACKHNSHFLLRSQRTHNDMPTKSKRLRRKPAREFFSLLAIQQETSSYATRIQTLTSDMGWDEARWNSCMGQCNLLRASANTSIEIQPGRSYRNATVSWTKHTLSNLGYTFRMQINSDIHFAANFEAVDGCWSNFCLLLVCSIGAWVSRQFYVLNLLICWLL